MLKAKDIHLAFGKREILSGVDVDLPPGRVSAILGPNGAGKTSLLRILSGELKPDAGSVEINGRLLGDFPVKRLGQLRAFLHQETSLDFAFTVREVVLLGRSPHMRSGERPQDYEAANRALAEADLLERAEDLYTNLSGGEKQRVHLARVLAQIDEPSIEENRFLFLDEPTNNLDLSHQKTINDIVLRLAARGVSVCVVLHDLNHAFRLADQVLILDKGRIALQGPPDEIAISPECEKIFGVNLRRIEIPGETTPFLYLS